MRRTAAAGARTTTIARRENLRSMRAPAASSSCADEAVSGACKRRIRVRLSERVPVAVRAWAAPARRTPLSGAGTLPLPIRAGWAPSRAVVTAIQRAAGRRRRDSTVRRVGQGTRENSGIGLCGVGSGLGGSPRPGAVLSYDPGCRITIVLRDDVAMTGGSESAGQIARSGSSSCRVPPNGSPGRPAGGWLRWKPEIGPGPASEVGWPANQDGRSASSRRQ